MVIRNKPSVSIKNKSASCCYRNLTHIFCNNLKNISNKIRFVWGFYLIIIISTTDKTHNE